jgi:inosine-uridine nucleoside N-ribohydrolase
MKKTKIIIDVDTGIDDAIALMVAVQCDKLDILGVTAVHGNAGVEDTTRNTLNVLKMFGREDIPVAKGASLPIVRNTIFAAHYAHGKHGLGNFRFDSNTDKALVDLPAWDFIYKTLLETDENITICCLGPTTNIATLLIKYPDIKEKIDRIFFMGGSYDSGTATPVASVNVYYDPDALQQIIHSSIPFYMVTMDATTKCCLLKQDIDYIRNLQNSTSKNLFSMMEFYMKGGYGDGRYPGLPMHDPTTIIAVTNPELFHYTKYRCEVELQGELTFGMTVIYKDNRETVIKNGKEIMAEVPEEKKNIWYMDEVKNRKVIELILNAFANA